MANHKLLDYSKQQLQQGVSKEAIINSLLSQGWQKQDIDEALSTVERPVSLQQSPYHMDFQELFKALIIISLLVTLPIILLVYINNTEVQIWDIGYEAVLVAPIASLITGIWIALKEVRGSTSQRVAWGTLTFVISIIPSFFIAMFASGFYASIFSEIFHK